MISVLEAIPEQADIKPFIAGFGNGVRQFGEALPPNWADERLESVRKGEEFCSAAVEDDRILGIIQYNLQEGRGSAFVSWGDTPPTAEAINLLIRKYVEKMPRDTWLRISGIHPNVPEELMEMASSTFGFVRKRRLEMAADLSSLPESSAPEGSFTTVSITEQSEETLSKLDWDSYSGTVDEGMFANSAEDNRKMFSSLLSGEYGPVITNASRCVTIEGKPVAMIAVTDIGDGAFLADIAVLPEYRKKGLGKYLLTNAMKEAAAARKKRMTLWVSEDNKPALTLYSSLGFRELRIGTYYIRKTVADVPVEKAENAENAVPPNA